MFPETPVRCRPWIPAFAGMTDVGHGGPGRKQVGMAWILDEGGQRRFWSAAALAGSIHQVVGKPLEYFPMVCG